MMYISKHNLLPKQQMLYNLPGNLINMQSSLICKIGKKSLKIPKR